MTPFISHSWFPDVHTRPQLLAAIGLACDLAEEHAVRWGVALDWSDAQIETRDAGEARVGVVIRAPWSPSPLVELHAPGEAVEAAPAPEGHDCGARCGDRLDEYGVAHRVHTYTACATCVGAEGIGDVPWPCPTLRAAGVTEDHRKLGAA